MASFFTVSLIVLLYASAGQTFDGEMDCAEVRASSSGCHYRSSEFETWCTSSLQTTTFVRHGLVGRRVTTELSDDRFSNITSISCSGLTLEHLDAQTIAGMPQLKSIDLSGNQIGSIRKGTFGGLRHLQSLSLNNNDLTVLKYNLFKGLHSLRKLDLRNNKLRIVNRYVLHGLWNLEELVLSGNRLTSVQTALHPLRNLQKLYLDNNHLASFEKSRNHQSRVHLPHLKVLNLASNRISEFTIEETRMMPQLRVLDLSDNLLMTLDEDVFEPTPNLRRLNLANNRLRRFPETIFIDLCLLTSLSLHNNDELTLIEVSDDVHIHVTGDQCTSGSLKLIKQRNSRCTSSSFEVTYTIGHCIGDIIINSSLETTTTADNNDNDSTTVINIALFITGILGFLLVVLIYKFLMERFCVMSSCMYLTT